LSELAPLLKQRFFDNNGLPLAGGFLYTYAAGTSTPLETFTDETGLTPNPNPVLLDANGYANVWLNTGSYKFVLEDANNVVQFTEDNVLTIASQIAQQVNLAGALDIINNLSDVQSKPASLLNLGIAPYQYQQLHAIANNQSAANLTGETFDGMLYTSVIYEYEIQQQFSGYYFKVVNANATIGATYTNNGITFTVVSTITGGIMLSCTGAGAPTLSGILTKATGTGDASIAFSVAVPLSSLFATGNFSVHFLNGTWTYFDGMSRGGTGHGLTFTLTQATTIGQIQAAESGLGNGTVKLKRHFFFA
jgi:hypothetical protein